MKNDGDGVPGDGSGSVGSGGSEPGIPAESNEPSWKLPFEHLKGDASRPGAEVR